MAHALTAEDLFLDLRNMPATERRKFFLILSDASFRNDDLSHEDLFGHLARDTFTTREAAEYLEISLSTLRRLVIAGRLCPSTTVGRNQMFSVPDLKNFKKALRATKASA